MLLGKRSICQLTTALQRYQLDSSEMVTVYIREYESVVNGTEPVVSRQTHEQWLKFGISIKMEGFIISFLGQFHSTRNVFSRFVTG